MAVWDSDILKTMMKGTRKKNSSHKYGTTMTRRLINAVKRRDAGLGRFDVGEVLAARDDPELLITAHEIQDLFLLRQDDHRRESDLGAQGDNGLGRITHFARGLRRRGRAEDQERERGEECQRSCHACLLCARGETLDGRAQVAPGPGV